MAWRRGGLEANSRIHSVVSVREVLWLFNDVSSFVFVCLRTPREKSKRECHGKAKVEIIYSMQTVS